MGAILFSSFKSECIALAPKSLDSEVANSVEPNVSYQGVKASKNIPFILNNLSSIKHFALKFSPNEGL